MGFSGEFGEAEQAALVRALLATGSPLIYTNRDIGFIRDLFRGSGARLESRELRHSIQPVYTAGIREGADSLPAMTHEVGRPSVGAVPEGSGPSTMRRQSFERRDEEQ
jgi:hypothetical protein